MAAQIDDFGVWGVELDVGFLRDDDGQEIALLGHTGPGDVVCWGGFVDFPEDSLIGFLNQISSTQSLRYRPVVIFFDWKTPDRDGWGEACPNQDCDGFGKNICETVFGVGNVLFPSEALDKTVPQLASKVILGMNQTFSGDCIDRETVGTLLDADPAIRFYRIDQYQSDWTFEYGVPPNPLLVDGATDPPFTVLDAEGDLWSCDNGDVSHGEVVAEQGTYRFPFKTVGRAVARAEGTTSNGFREERRSGFGWTVLIKPGNYAESLRIDIPLTLAKDDRFDGTVMIAGQPGRMVRSIWITFRTNDDGKDPDTGLLVEVRSNDRVLARFQQRRDKKYGEVFTHTEQLQLFGPVFETEMSGAVLALDITPNGNDTWRFDWELNGTWSDGLPFSDGQVGIDLDEDKRHFEKVLRF